MVYYNNIISVVFFFFYFCLQGMFVFNKISICEKQKNEWSQTRGGAIMMWYLEGGSCGVRFENYFPDV
jgi:TRAP-type mannitol/chloroaromatic compound transport system permease small subunit